MKSSQKQALKRLSVYAFLFAWLILTANYMFLAGELYQQYGGSFAKDISYIVGIIAIFHVGRFVERFKNQNPL